MMGVWAFAHRVNNLTDAQKEALELMHDTTI